MSETPAFAFLRYVGSACAALAIAWPGLASLPMHATDRERLEPRLGQRESKGCIRIPATLNVWLDRYGVLDAAYEEAIAAGREFWVLRSDRDATPWSGRYLVIVDSQRFERPPWSVAPASALPYAAAAAWDGTSFGC